MHMRRWQKLDRDKLEIIQYLVNTQGLSRAEANHVISNIEVDLMNAQCQEALDALQAVPAQASASDEGPVDAAAERAIWSELLPAHAVSLGRLLARTGGGAVSSQGLLAQAPKAAAALVLLAPIPQRCVRSLKRMKPFHHVPLDDESTRGLLRGDCYSNRSVAASFERSAPAREWTERRVGEGFVSGDCAGVGGVCSHPVLARGAGYVQQLMDHILARMKAEGYHLSVLGGIEKLRFSMCGWGSIPARA